MEVVYTLIANSSYLFFLVVQSHFHAAVRWLIRAGSPVSAKSVVTELGII